MDHDLNRQPIEKRLQQGKYEAEAQVFARLKIEFGDRIQQADDWGDKYGKTDCILDGKRSSIKCRIDKKGGGDDLLSCLSQPYTGKASLMTGRDAQEYFRVFCRCKAGNRIRDFCGRFVHKVNQSVVNEYLQTASDILALPGNSFTSSLQYDGWYCQLQSWRDERNNQLKVCCFIPEEYAKHFNAVKIIDCE